MRFTVLTLAIVAGLLIGCDGANGKNGASGATGPSGTNAGNDTTFVNDTTIIVHADTLYIHKTHPVKP